MAGTITPRKSFVPSPVRPSTGITATATNPSSITVENGLVTDMQAGTSTSSGGTSGGGTSTTTEGINVSDGTLTYPDIGTLTFPGAVVFQLPEGNANIFPPAPSLQSLIGAVNGTSAGTGNKTFILPFLVNSGYIIFADRGVLFPGFDYSASTNSSGQTVITTTYAPINWIAAIGW